MKKISVVVLTKNSQKHINDCLRSIIGQKCPNFEIIVVDSKSTDRTLEIILLNYIKCVRLISVPFNTSIGMARQIGVDNSHGDIIAFVDSDVELPHENWLENMYRPFIITHHNPPDGIQTDEIAGTQTLAKAKNTDPWILKHLHSKFEYKNKVIDSNNYEIIGTGHTLIRKDLIEDVGGFRDISSHEDIDMTRKIIERGYKFIYLPEEKVYHYHVDDLWSYIKKHWIRNKRDAIRRILFE